MALQAHPLGTPVKRAKVITHRQTGSARFLPVAHQHVQAKVFVPADERVAHQAGNVVGDGAVQRVLKIQNAQGLAAATVHQVARHKVAVHVDKWPGQVFLGDGVKSFVQHPGLRLVQGDLAVLAQVPLGKQAHFTAQKCFVVGRQHAGARGLLPA